MKRCPECLFIYPDSDARCDFDNTPLVAVDESVIEAVTDQTPKQTKPKRTTKKRARKATALTAVVGLMLGVAAFMVYYRSTQHTTKSQATPIATAQQIMVSIPAPSPLTTASPTPTATPTPYTITKPTTDRIATAHTTTTTTPISTSGPGTTKNGKTTILLTTGSKLYADEVWRTRDGVWYRRDGIVTLLKRGQVKAII